MRQQLACTGGEGGRRVPLGALQGEEGVLPALHSPCILPWPALGAVHFNPIFSRGWPLSGNPYVMGWCVFQFPFPSSTSSGERWAALLQCALCMHMNHYDLAALADWMRCAGFAGEAA